MTKRKAHRIALRLAYEALQKATDAGSDDGSRADEHDPKVDNALDALTQQAFERWQRAEERAKI